MIMKKFSVLFTNGNGVTDVQGMFTDYTQAQILAQMVQGKVIAVDIEIPDSSGQVVMGANQMGKATRVAASKTATAQSPKGKVKK